MRVPLRLSAQSAGRKVIAGIAIALIASAGAIALRYAPGTRVALGKLDDLLYDSFYRLRPLEDRTHGPVVIVAVDQRSLDDLNNPAPGKKAFGWPWPREFWGRVVEYLNRSGAKVIAFDITFTDASDYDKSFAKYVNAATVPIVFGNFVGPDGKPARFAPPVTRPVFGAVNLGDELVFREYHPAVYDFPSLALRTVTAYGSEVPAPFRAPFLLHYYGPHRTNDGKQTFHYVSASHVISAATGQHNASAEPQVFRDKIVLIGAIAAATYDLKASPLSPVYPGVEVHATAIENMLRGERVLGVAPAWAVAATVLAALCAAVGVAVPRRAWTKLLLAAVVTGALFAAAGGLFLRQQIVWLPTAAPLLALLLAVVGAFEWSYLTEGRQRRFVLKALAQYVSPEVAAEIDRNPAALKLGGVRREMTVMFTDIQGFTDLSEKLEERKLTDLLNYYLDEMSSLVLANDGTLDKYIGDAIMSFWNAPIEQPDHALLACRAALEMEKREREIQPELQRLGAAGMLTRIGINTGPMVFGNMGSSQKFNYSVLGDAVNLGSRLEGANKFYGSRVLISQTTADLVRGKFVMRQLDLLRVKGKQKPMAVYELMAGQNGNADLAVRVNEYEAAFQLYQQQNWAQAESRLTALRQTFPNDAPAAALLERIAHLREHPPGPDWDGVYAAKGK